jgi:hypothetical protein
MPMGHDDGEDDEPIGASLVIVHDTGEPGRVTEMLRRDPTDSYSASGPRQRGFTGRWIWSSWAATPSPAELAEHVDACLAILDGSPGGVADLAGEGWSFGITVIFPARLAMSMYGVSTQQLKRMADYGCSLGIYVV